MIHKTFKGKIKLSQLGMGNMRLPTQGDIPGAQIDYKRAEEIIDYAMAHGVNYYDTAYVYHSGESEKFLGNVMAKYPRDSYHLATKYFIMASPDYKSVFEEQLSRLKTDYIDFYLIHGIFDNTADNYISTGAVDYFIEQKKAGRIKYLGFSTHAAPEVLKRFAAHHDRDFAQMQLNYFDWNYGQTKKEYEILTELNIPIIVMEPVRGGRLANLSEKANKILQDEQPGKSIASWAMRWVMGLENVQVILSGMSTLEQIKDNVSTFEEGNSLSDEQKDLLLKACAAFKDEMSVPCTACRYCCDDCPAGLDIPNLLSAYNNMQVGNPREAWDMLRTLPDDKKPSACIECGSCANHCPQGIQVPEILKKLNR
jgi:predicted aldo/keto reductase-like oxidoreductase